ncbi:hypothetical protein BJ741DRAFT_588915 [Chytriomyces cf. hyalinus JEL632]|nr:hypothetical protein BJ741DRAFT_588915 [Chytriomyces cf. hyalinus JEL632]
MDQPHSTASTSLSLDLLVAAAAMAPIPDTGFTFRQPCQKLSTHPMSISNLAFDHQDISDITCDPSMPQPQYEYPSIPPPQCEQPAAPAWPRNALKDNKLPFTLISPPITPMFSNTSITKSQVQQPRTSFPTTTRSDSASLTNICFEDTCSKEPLCMSQSPAAAARNHEMLSRPHRRCAPSFQETTPPATSSRKQLPREDVLKRGTAAKYVCRFCPKSFKRKHHVESHEVTHSTAYNFVCTLPGCASKFRRNQDLLRHWRNVKH